MLDQRFNFSYKRNFFQTYFKLANLCTSLFENVVLLFGEIINLLYRLRLGHLVVPLRNTLSRIQLRMWTTLQCGRPDKKEPKSKNRCLWNLFILISFRPNVTPLKNFLHVQWPLEMRKQTRKHLRKRKKTSWEKMRKIPNFLGYSDATESRTYEQN